MKIEINLKDAIVFALILAIVVIGGIKIVRIEAAMQTAALVKTVNDQGAALQEIVKFLNGKPWAVPPAKGIDLVNTPKTK